MTPQDFTAHSAACLLLQLNWSQCFFKKKKMFMKMYKGKNTVNGNSKMMR